MPQISTFFVNIKDGVVKGEMPSRALKLIFEWMEEHREELMKSWKQTVNGEYPNKIEPLD